MKHPVRTRAIEALAILTLTLICGMARADLVGGTFISGTVNPTNWDQVNGQAPFYTSFKTTNILFASANVMQIPPSPGPYAQSVVLSETITPRQTNWVLTGFAILAGPASAGQPSLHIFDESALLTGTYSNSASASYYIVATNGTGGDLLGGGYGLNYTQLTSSVTNQVTFIFTNGPMSTDQIVLGVNRRYAVELWAPWINSSEVNWMRTAATPVDANAGGQGMAGADAAGIGNPRLTLSASGLAGSAPRTFALALYGYMTNAPFTVSTNLPLLTNDVPPPVTNGNCIVDWNNVHQRIDGFGASSAWQNTWTTPVADILFSTNNAIVYTDTLGAKSTNNGIGLSLLRNHILYAGSASASATPTTVETSIMQMAQTRGAKIWSAPWTPAVGFKNTNNLYGSLPITNSVNGGSYLGTGNNITNLAYASQLANYVVSMKSQGINLYGISIQNEPDAQVNTYEACQWTGAQIHDFTTNLYNALLAQNVTSTMIMLPESQNWSDPHNFADTVMSDPNAAADVGIVADHNYDGINGPVTLTKNNYGKPLWETEVAILSGSDGSITNGVYYAQRIHLFMTVAQANAYHYWWLMCSTTTTNGNEGLMDNKGSITKRLFAFGQFSRFVRPNYYRIDVTNTTSALISAYNDTNSGNFAMVAVNNNGVSINQTFNLTNFSTASVTPWMTTSNLSLASQTPVVVSGSSFTYTLPAMSVVTFVGQQSINMPTNTPPALQPVADQVVNAGMTLMVTNVASDMDQPPQTLTFSLLNGPGNLNPTNGVFNWRPPVASANTTNPVSVAVTDNGTPNLSATNNFNVIVNPLLIPVTVSSITAGMGQVSLLVTGPLGPDYTLLGSTNLMNWSALFTTNSPGLPVLMNDSSLSNNPVGFYRIQIGP